MIRWCVLMILVLSAYRGACSTRTDSLIQVLVHAIETRDVSVNARLQRLDLLKQKLALASGTSLEERFTLYDAIYNEYKTFIYDSAFSYAQKLIDAAYRLRDNSKIGYARVQLGFILVSSGMFKETFDSLASAPVKDVADTTKVQYYYVMARTYYDLGTYNNDNHYLNQYSRLASQFMDSARAKSKPGSYDYFSHSALQNLKNNKNIREAMEYLEKVLKTPLTPQKRAVSCHNLGLMYKSLNETDKAIEYFVYAAMADLEAATKETAAMFTLAKLLFELGDVDNSYIFIEQAMDDAVYYGARQRKVEIGSLLQVIASKRLNSSEEQRKLWFTYATVVTVLSVLVIVFAIVIVRQLKKLKVAELSIIHANERLQETNHNLREAIAIKDEYIGYYFNINSEYINKIEELKTSVDHKLTNRKYDDIKYIVNSIDLKREREALYFNFDKVFLKLFPDFVTEFNSFFDEKDRTVLKDNQLLNTELRIFALIRLGISDTEKIAKILNYSVNTIYAYKTRVKSKSKIANEEFEQKIMGIKTA